MNTQLKTTRADRQGFTLVELLISLMIFGIIVAGALGFMTTQNKHFHEGADRITALTNLQFAMQSLTTDVSTLGTNLVPKQEGMVYASGSIMAFNADYATNAGNDPFAVYYDPDAPNGQVTSPQTAITVPGSAPARPCKASSPTGRACRPRRRISSRRRFMAMRKSHASNFPTSV